MRYRSNCFPLLGKWTRTAAAVSRQKRSAAYRLLRWRWMSKYCMWRAIVSCCRSHSSKPQAQRSRHWHKRCTRWHQQHCKCQLSKGDIQADQQQHTFPPHIQYNQMRKAKSSDREHMGCSAQSQNSTTFLQGTSNTAVQRLTNIQRGTWYTHRDRLY